MQRHRHSFFVLYKFMEKHGFMCISFWNFSFYAHNSFQVSPIPIDFIPISIWFHSLLAKYQKSCRYKKGKQFLGVLCHSAKWGMQVEGMAVKTSLADTQKENQAESGEKIGNSHM